MSTEHQQYSPVKTDAIAQYAAINGTEIVRTYSDHGRSGLDLAGRLGLRSLLEDVARDTQDFSELLVYDISRWVGFRTLTRAPTMSTCSSEPAFALITARRASPMMEASLLFS
jgi:DNA invertase Pin-like site-specific DNA recombinase